ncbi:hypothetical protein ACM742_30615, partial [Pseudomonas aeruginosa]
PLGIRSLELIASSNDRFRLVASAFTTNSPLLSQRRLLSEVPVPAPLTIPPVARPGITARDDARAVVLVSAADAGIAAPPRVAIDANAAAGAQAAAVVPAMATVAAV